MNVRLSASVAAMLATLGSAALELPEIMSSNAVLQQQTDARLWGKAAPGARVSVTASWAPGEEYSARADAKGDFIISVPTPAATFEPQTITFAEGSEKAVMDNVLIGEVWLCSGQSNMEMPLRGFGIQPIEGAAQAIAYSRRYPGVRVVTVPKTQSYKPEDTVPGRWKTSSPENAAEFSALAYFFATSLTDILGVPVGVIADAYGGASVEGWMPKEKLDTYPGYDMAAEEADSTKNPWERIGVMYNAMFHPVRNYTVKGILWNQGESNVGRDAEYPGHLADMVEIWRRDLKNPDAPFYYVEMPPWSYSAPDEQWGAYFRECQHKAAAMIPNSGVVCTTDLIYPHEVEDVHASRKQPIGERLAFMAAARTYGVNGIPADYPAYKSVDLQGDKAVLTFSNSTGGLNPNMNIKGFEVAGADRVFHPATAVEDWNTFTITVSSPEVSDIQAVRYCFRNFSPGTLKDMYGMPLVPFRTDSWPIDTVNNKK